MLLERYGLVYYGCCEPDEVKFRKDRIGARALVVGYESGGIFKGMPVDSYKVMLDEYRRLCVRS